MHPVWPNLKWKWQLGDPTPAPTAWNWSSHRQVGWLLDVKNDSAQPNLSQDHISITGTTCLWYNWLCETQNSEFVAVYGVKSAKKLKFGYFWPLVMPFHDTNYQVIWFIPTYYAMFWKESMFSKLLCIFKALKPIALLPKHTFYAKCRKSAIGQVFRLSRTTGHLQTFCTKHSMLGQEHQNIAC